MGCQRIPGVLLHRIGKALGLIAVAVAVLLAVSQSRRPIDAALGQEGPLKGQGESPGHSTSSAPRSAAVALARLVPTEGLISVGVRPGIRIDEIKVKEGDQVSQGAILAVLEGHAAARNQLALAKAQKTLKQREQNARLAAARKAAGTSKTRLGEANALYKQFGGMLKGKERYDAEMALYQVEMQSLKDDLDLQLLEAAGQAQAPGERGPADEILDAQVALAEAALAEAEVRSPRAGRVLRIAVHAGELGAGTLLEMGDLSSMAATAEVYQSDLPRIHLNDPAEVDILGSRVPGKVTRIGSMVGSNRLTSVDPRALRDLRVVELTIQLDHPAEASRYVNMEVEATIHPSGASPTSTDTNKLRTANRP
ncbi:MAG: HlyD family efflux transporter periplasmic adaptor subunit [Isosphaeraceae bacterium]